MLNGLRLAGMLCSMLVEMAEVREKYVIVIESLKLCLVRSVVPAPASRKRHWTENHPEDGYLMGEKWSHHVPADSILFLLLVRFDQCYRRAP